MIKKMKNCFTNNMVLSVVLVILGIIVACLAWKYIVTGAVPEINQMNEQIAYETDCEKNISEENRFEYTQFGTIYHAPTGIDAGPFKYLYTDARVQ